MKEYRKRIADDLLARKLRGLGAVLVQGPKWCGKTTTCEQQSASVLHVDDPDTREANIRLADINIKELLAGERPRLIDEWQLAPKFWDAVRYQVDHEGGSGLFVLTGSAVPPDTSLMSHSGTGRISRLTMRTMSLWESGESSGGLSLGELFGGNGFLSCKAHGIGLRDMATIVCRGGWPAAVMHEGPEAQDLAAVRALTAEMKDRFGPPPPEVDEYARVAELRVRCAMANISNIDTKGTRAVLYKAGSSEIFKVVDITGKTPRRKLSELTAAVVRLSRPTP